MNEKSALKRLFKIVNGSTPKSDIASYWGGDVVWVTPEDLGKLRSDSIATTRRQISREGLANCGASIVPAESIILSTRAPIGNVAIGQVPLCTNQGCKSLVPRSHNVLTKFFFYQVQALKTELNVLGNGTTFLELSAEKLGQVVLFAPPLQRQKIIAKFLDRETADADALVAKYERLILLLEEKRVALITQAVTKGLDASVAMKDSGIAWIGEVPFRWNVSPIRHIAKTVETGGTPPETDFAPEGIPWYAPGDFGNEIDLGQTDKRISVNADSMTIFPKRSVLVVGIGATLGKVGLPPSESSSNQQCNAIIPNDDINARFLAYALVACYDEMRSRASSSTLPILNQSKTKSLELPVPPQPEQEQIASWIDSRLAEISALIEKTTLAISMVREHRSALITAAVTGQIDVSTYHSRKQQMEVPA